MNTFNNIDTIVDYLETVSATKFDSTMPLSNLRAVATEDDIHLQVDSRTPIEKMFGSELPQAWGMTRSAFRSLLYRMGEAKAWTFMRDSISRNLPEEGAALLNAMFAHEKYNSNKRGPKDVFVRSRATDDGAIHRAVFSGKYVAYDMLNLSKVVQAQVHAFANMPNTDELMNAMRQQHGMGVSIVNDNDDKGIGHKIERANIGIDGMSFRVRYNLQFETDELGPFYVGAFIRTDEIGGSSVHVLPYIWREVCKNGMVASYERNELKLMRDSNGWSPIFPHLWGSIEDLEYKATQAMAYASGYGTQLVAKARQAAYRTIPNASEVLGRMLEAMVPKDQLQQTTLVAGAGFEGENTVMGLVNAVTAAAHTTGLNQDVVDTLESTGGTALRQYKDDMDDKEITNLFLRLAKAELLQVEEM